jgi:hypothetical protein
MLHHIGQFWSRLSEQRTMWHTLQHSKYSLDLAPTDFTCSLDWNQHWRDGAFRMLLTSLRMRRNTWKGFHKSASRNVPTPLQSLEEVYRCTRGLLWRKCSLNDLHFSEIKWFREHFTATTCNFSPVKNLNRLKIWLNLSL